MSQPSEPVLTDSPRGRRALVAGGYGETGRVISTRLAEGSADVAIAGLEKDPAVTLYGSPATQVISVTTEFDIADLLAGGPRPVEKPAPHPGKLLDVVQLALYKGGVHSEAEFAALFESAGLRIGETRKMWPAGPTDPITAVAA